MINVKFKSSFILLGMAQNKREKLLIKNHIPKITITWFKATIMSSRTISNFQHQNLKNKEDKPFKKLNPVTNKKSKRSKTVLTQIESPMPRECAINVIIFAAEKKMLICANTQTVWCTQRACVTHATQISQKTDVWVKIQKIVI